jgi:CopA family copper-resistance protein
MSSPVHPDRRTSGEALELTLSRRQFVEGLAVGGLVVAAGMPRLAIAQSDHLHHHAHAPRSQREVEFTIGEQTVNLTGRERKAVTVNRSLPAPVLRFREGDQITLRVTNRLKEDTSIHWHGILLPANMDGVPGLSFHGIPPGETFTYSFRLKQSGTYWYHSHSSMQEALGLYGALIIDPREPEPFQVDRDHVLVLSDWSDENPHRILEKLKKQGTYYNYHQRTVGDFFRDVRRQGWAAAWADRKAWGEMRMTPTDLADVSGATYTYLVNGTTPAGNWTGLFSPGEKVRLRFINASAMTYFDVRIPGLKMTVVAADGQPVQPVAVDEFRIAVAETVDVIVEPLAPVYTIFAQSMDRTGYARASLATVKGLQAIVPTLDPRPLLTMQDMGHGDHAEHGAATSHQGHAQTVENSHAGHDMSAMAHEGHASHESHEEVVDPHAGHDMPATNIPAKETDHALHGAIVEGMQTHPVSESNNPMIDMQTMNPVPRLADPGIGLRDNGRRVLTYADLRSSFPDPDGREPSRTIELHLTGHMERYAWSFDGIPFAKAEPIRLKYGERVRVVLVNDTMMEHPIHLHGMWSDLEDEDGNFLVRKHTITMPPGTRRSFRVTADALGRWAFHCHLLMHMDAGMFREVRVEA